MDNVEQTIRLNNLSKELRKYGFAQSSQDAIAQAGAIFGSPNQDELKAQLQTADISQAQMNEILNKMQRLWIFKENSDHKMSAVTDQVVKVTDKLNELIKSISLIEMNQAIFDKKLNTLKDSMGDVPRTEVRESRSYDRDAPRESRYVEESSTREKEKRLERPIDRNNVAPADVSIQKIFYCGK